MRKFCSVLLMVLFASMSLLTGCDLISLNEAKYYNTVVMTIGETEITKDTLIEMYNSWGTSYVDQGYSVEYAMELTIDNIIARELLVDKAKEELGELSQADKNDVWQEVYDEVNSTLKEYEGQIKAEWGVVVNTETEEEEEEVVTYDTFIEYESAVTYLNGEIVKVAQEEDPIEEPIGDFAVVFNGEGIETDVYADIQTEAWDRYIRLLKISEAWENLSTVNDEVFQRQLDKMYETYEDNKYLTNFQEAYEYNEDVDNVAIKNKYIELVQDSFAKYSIDMDAYHTAMGSDASSVYYHPSEQYVQVSNILIGYTDEQEELLDELEQELIAGTKDQTAYDIAVASIQAQIGGKERNEDGEEFGDIKLASTILAELELAMANKGDSTEAEVFNEFIYKYNTDPGMFNAETPYVVNIDTEVEDKMVEAFADASRELYVEGENSLSELVLTEFGYHIIFYSSPAENIIDYNMLTNITVQALYDTKLNAGSSKTMYDKIYEDIYESAYATYQSSLIEQLESEIEIKIYESRYNEFFN